MEELAELAWEPKTGKVIAKGSGERESWGELIIPRRLRYAIGRTNPGLPASAVEDAAKVVLSATSRDARAENRRLHTFLTEGIREVVYTDEYGAEQNPTIWLLDRRNAENNDFMAARQVRVVDGEHRRQFDVVLYVNGMPLAFIELKRATAGGDGLKDAHTQLTGTYVAEFPLAFRCNVACVVSDGFEMRYGTAFTPFEHFAPWNVDDMGTPVDQPAADLVDQPVMLLLHGMFRHDRFVDLLFGYVAFARGEDGPMKRIAKPHQYFAVEEAVRKTVEAVRGDGRAGVIWHTQGSGKSMEMELYASQVLRHPSLGNPTIVVLTDRTDLDDQLFTTFGTSELLPGEPVQIGSREELRAELANRLMGGIYFTTLQKFGRTQDERDNGLPHPRLSDRRNVIVIVDEAHRSHYDDLDGYARHLRDALPNASFIAFTGTPISEGAKGRDTRAVFGEYIELIYDLTQAVKDGATVPVFFESRLIDVSLPESVKPEDIDERADQITVGLDDSERERIQQRVIALNAVYGAPDRVRQLTEDVIAHWEARSAQLRKFIGVPGKGMIVCATRDICADLYERIVERRPDWGSDHFATGKIKVVYTGDASDPAHLQRHIRRPSQNKVIQQRAKDPDDELELLIVQSMLLTGFDAPPLHTIYIDKPMRGAALMQALARVNRTFRDKQDGLLVGYAPLTDSLYEALAEYSARDQNIRPMGRDLDQAIAKVRDMLSVIGEEILSGYDWKAAREARGPKAHLYAVLGAVNYLRDPATPGNQVADGELTLAQRFRQASATLARMYAICSSHRDMAAFRADIAFFEEIRTWMARFDAEERRARGEAVPPDIELYLKALTASAIESGGVTDIYAAAGLDRPDLSHLDEAFIERMRAQRNPALAIEALRRVIEQEMRKVTRHNIVKQASFSDRLADLMRRYVSQNLSSAQVIAELVALAKEVSADANRGNAFAPPLSPDELAFYDAVARNDSAVTEMGATVLADIARDLVRTLRRDVTTDWVSRDDVRAKIRSTIKRLLAKYGYPPDAREDATALVLRQMETFADEWSPAAPV